MDIKKLTPSEIKPLRETLLETQHECPLCGRHFETVEPVLDHNHDTGMIRGLLCRNCNGWEGRIMSSAKRASMGNGITFLQNLVTYLLEHKDNPSGLIHPSHGKPKRRYRRRKVRKTKR